MQYRYQLSNDCTKNWHVIKYLKKSLNSLICLNIQYLYIEVTGPVWDLSLWEVSFQLRDFQGLQI